jgi:uncharacterized protein (TIGR03000 family)
MRALFGLVALAAACLAWSLPARAEAPEGNKAAVVITVLVPAGAEVSFDGTRTQQSGTMRRFVSPPIATGKTFKYQVAVTGGADKMNVTRALRVRGGEQITLDFRDGQVRETRGTGSAFFEPEAARRAPAYVPTPFSGPRAMPFSPDNSTRNQPYGFAGAVGGG